MPLLLAFDIGVKNLAFCLYDTASATVVGLENVNLLAPVEPIHCSHPCTHLARYTVIASIASATVTATSYCKRHLPKTHTVLKELEAKKVSRQTLKDLVEEHKCDAHGTTMDAYRQALSVKFAFHVIQPKQEAVAKLSLEEIHDALHRFVESQYDTFQGVTHVLLENQPAFKNPHMKSVQVLLFATLREAFLRQTTTPCPSFHLIHAKKKVGDAKKGDAGYSERKQKSEERVKQLFESTIKGQTHYEHWKQAKKKSDMADAVCMAVDFVPVTH